MNKYDTSQVMLPLRKKIYDLLVAGEPLKQIGDKVHASDRTVKYHAQRIYKMFGVATRVELMAKVLVQNETFQSPDKH